MTPRSVFVKITAFVALTVLGIGYILLRYLSVGDAVVGHAYTAYVDLPDSGGIFSSASVTYRGVEVGKVGAISLRPDGIRVALHITSDRHIPANARAVVGNGSAIGEQYIDLQPTDNNKPFLHNGSVIPQNRTNLPVTTQQLVVDVDKLIRSVPRSQLVTLINELGKGFSNAGPPLRKLLDSAHTLLQNAQQNINPTVSLIDQSGPVLDTQLSSAGDIQSFANNLASFTDALRRGDPDIRKVLGRGPDFATQLNGLDRDIDVTLPLMLNNLTSLGQVIAVRLPALQQVFIGYPYVIATTFGIFPGCPGNPESTHCASTVRFGIPTPADFEPGPCTRGYLPPPAHRLPSQENFLPFRFGPRCAEPTNSQTLARGPQQAPEPDGRRLGDEPSYQNNDGLPNNGGGWNGAPGPFAGNSSASPQSFGMHFAGRDDAGGVLASDGDQQPALGDRSWMLLILGPLEQ